MRDVETITKQFSGSQWGRDSVGTGHGPISDPESFKASIHLVTCHSLATCRLAEHLLRAGPRSDAGTLWSRENSGPVGPGHREGCPCYQSDSRSPLFPRWSLVSEWTTSSLELNVR